MSRKRHAKGVDYGTLLNEYLCTEYLYHTVCLTEGCGYVRHELPGVRGDECPKCGGDCWQKGMGCTPKVAAPWYVQFCEPTCPTCRKTLARLMAFEAQLGLFEVGAT